MPSSNDDTRMLPIYLEENETKQVSKSKVIGNRPHVNVKINDDLIPFLIDFGL